MDNLSYLSNADVAYIDSLYQSYKENGESVDFGWQKFFEGYDFGRGSEASVVTAETPKHFLKEINVLNLINGYRTRGHLFTKTNPVRERRTYSPDLSLETFGLTEEDLDLVFNVGGEVGIGSAKLSDIIALLNQTYCQSIGAEYRYIRNPDKIKWFEERMERERNTPAFSIDNKLSLIHI